MIALLSRPAIPGPSQLRRQTRALSAASAALWAALSAILSAASGSDRGDGDAEELEVMVSVEDDVADDINVGYLSTVQKAIKYGQWGLRPNVHAAKYYLDDLIRFGLPLLQMVLPGEMKYR